MAVFRVERTRDYTVMSNHHLRNKELTLKAKGLLSQMLSLPEDWDYTLKGLAAINRESIDAIRTAVLELEQAGYIVRSRVRDERGCLRACDYIVYERPQEKPPKPTWENPTLDNPTLVQPTLEKPMRQSWNRWRSAALWGVRPSATSSKPGKRLPSRQRQNGPRRKSLPSRNLTHGILRR